MASAKIISTSGPLELVQFLGGHPLGIDMDVETDGFDRQDPADLGSPLPNLTLHWYT